MDISTQLQSLQKLNHLEAIGRQYHDHYGRNLEFPKYLLLSRYAKEDLPSISYLTAPEFEAECNELTAKNIARFRGKSLSDEEFIHPDCDIEIEKLLRYIDIPAHQHSFVEMSFVFSGACRHTVLGNTYTQSAGCFTFIHSNVEHKLSAEADSLCLTIKIRSDTFSKFLVPNLPYFAVPICFECGDDPFIRTSILQAYLQQESEGCYHDEIISHLIQAVLIYMMQNYRDTMMFLYSGTPMQRKLLEISNYIFENHRTVTLRSLARHFGYSESYMSRFFRQNVGESFSTALRNYKLNRAKVLLQTTSWKLNDICDDIGYSDVTQFIRDFKKAFQITPAQFRKQFQDVP